MRLLRVLALGLEGATLGHRVRVAVTAADGLARLAQRLAGHLHRVGPHVGDEADVPVGRVDALVQALGDAHRPLGAETELAARLLLERRGGERRRGAALALLDRDTRDPRLGPAELLDVARRGRLVADVELLAVDA